MYHCKQGRFPSGYDEHEDEVGGVAPVIGEAVLGAVVGVGNSLRNLFSRERWIALDELVEKVGDRTASVTKRIAIHGNGINFVGKRRTKCTETMNIHEFVEQFREAWPHKYSKARPHVMMKGDTMSISYEKGNERVEYKVRLV